jgi:hypothetical protein
MFIDVPYNAKTYEFVNSISWMGEDGIVYSKPKPGRFIKTTRDQMHEEMKKFLLLTGGRKVCMIAVSHPDIKEPEREEMDYMSEQLEKVINALAIINTNSVSAMVAHLFFIFKPPKYPMKMFTRVSDAKNWLQGETIQCKPMGD